MRFLAALTHRILKILRMVNVLAVQSKMQCDCATSLRVNFSAAKRMIEFTGQILVAGDGDVGILAVEIASRSGVVVFMILDHVILQAPRR